MIRLNKLIITDSRNRGRAAVSKFIFPVGYEKMHRIKIIDFQLNRWYSFGYARLADMQKAAKRIKNLLEASQVLLKFNAENLSSDLVLHDVLILTGAEDHFIPLKMHYMQVRALKNARSITEHILTRKEQGQNHCQIGNIGLSLKTMSEWIKEKSQ